EDSHGSVLKHSVRTCSSEEIYVGKNEYGLGKVYPKDHCFYLPWKGTEYWYWYYEVLTLVIPESNLISNVKYDQNRIKIFKEPPKTIQTSVAVNDACRPVSKTVSLTKKTMERRQWDTRSSFRSNNKTKFRAGVPLIVEENLRSVLRSHLQTQENKPSQKSY
ncbi:hypothetical protein AMECASPLE_016251, partial [Ameca splendens]